jgi:iron(III) transport system permease protein
MWGLRSSRTVVIAIATLAFVVFCVLPVLYMMADALSAPTGAVFIDSRQRGLLYTTMLLGAGTATLATLVGAPLGFVLARVPLPFKMAWRLALVAPALLPPYVVALAWIYLNTRVIAMLPAIDGVLPSPYSLAGAIAVLATVFYPLAMLTTEVGLRRVEPHLEEAASLAATPVRALWCITGPLIAPNVLAAALVIFVLVISEFSVPGLLRVRVFTTEVFTAFAAAYDFAGATRLAMLPLVLSVCVAAAGATLARDRIVATRRGSAGAPPIAFMTWQQPALAACVCVVVVGLIVPVTLLAVEALGAASLITVINGSRDAVTNSLVLAGVGATAVTTVAMVLGYARARANRRLGAAIDVIWVVLFTVPSTVVGIGLIGLWNRTGWMGAPYGTPAMLVLGYLARFVPVAALVLAATTASVPESHEEAAAIAGAGWLQSIWRIVVPQIRIGLAGVWVIVFILAFGEVGTSILVAPPGESTLPIRVYTLTANAPPGHIAGIALFQSAVILCPLLLFGAALGVRARR